MPYLSLSQCRCRDSRNEQELDSAELDSILLSLHRRSTEKGLVWVTMEWPQYCKCLTSVLGLFCYLEKEQGLVQELDVEDDFFLFFGLYFRGQEGFLSFF